METIYSTAIQVLTVKVVISNFWVSVRKKFIAGETIGYCFYCSSPIVFENLRATTF